jgi:hypothetical protein
MARKSKKIRVERPVKDSDTLAVVEFADSEWALINAYFDLNMNQTRAYMSVFKDAKYESARVEASKFFAKPNIRAEIEYRLERDAMSASEAMKRMSDIARASHAPFIRIDDDGFVYFDFSDPQALENLHLIKKIETKRERRVSGMAVGGDGEAEPEEWEGEWVKVELHDSASALRDVLKIHGKYKEEVNLNVTKPIIIEVIKSGEASE